MLINDILLHVKGMKSKMPKQVSSSPTVLQNIQEDTLKSLKN
jgi:hypothetical protein